MLKWVDTPPVWLAAALALAWAQSRWLPMGLGFGAGPVPDLLGGLLVGAGVLLVLMAAFEFRRAHTTLLPHETPETLVTTGIYSRSRNPIYLADLLILAGFILFWDAVPSLVLLPVLLWVLERRFVLPEEKRMRRVFRADFARYAHKVRRWI